jgi:hypothetical protein
MARAQNPSGVTKREVRKLLMEGKDNAEIAHALSCTVGNVKRALACLCRDYGVRTSRGHPRVNLAVAIFNAGDCPCTACRDASGRRAENAPMPETMHVEPGRTNIFTMLDLYGDGNGSGDGAGL